MFNNPLITNPAELALPYADKIEPSSKLDTSESEEQLLTELDRLTAIADMHSIYFAQVFKALSIPASFESDSTVSIGNFNSIAFEGKLITYSIVKIGRIIGQESVRALCLSFDEVTLLPLYDYLPTDHLLHVPVVAVDSMLRTSF
jgi:hypothetical protein